MGLDLRQWHRWVLCPVLDYLAPEIPRSLSGERLLLMTAVHESAELRYIDQNDPGDRPGPAYGVYQIESATHRDLWVTWLTYRPTIERKLRALLAPWPSPLEQLRTNLAYTTAIARVIYYRDPEPLPAANDIEGLGKYAKRVWNTYQGKATVKHYVDAWHKAERALYA